MTRSGRPSTNLGAWVGLLIVITGRPLEVWPGEINWDVDTTTGVLWLRSNGTSWVVFEARRAGTARAIARHNALADTAVVVVH